MLDSRTNHCFTRKTCERLVDKWKSGGSGRRHRLVYLLGVRGHPIRLKARTRIRHVPVKMKAILGGKTRRIPKALPPTPAGFQESPAVREQAHAAISSTLDTTHNGGHPTAFLLVRKRRETNVRCAKQVNNSGNSRRSSRPRAVPDLAATSSKTARDMQGTRFRGSPTRLEEVSRPLLSRRIIDAPGHSRQSERWCAEGTGRRDCTAGTPLGSFTRSRWGACLTGALLCRCVHPKRENREHPTCSFRAYRSRRFFQAWYVRFLVWGFVTPPTDTHPVERMITRAPV